MFEGGFVPGLFHFFTLNIFDGIAGNTNWVGVIGYIGVLFWIGYRISNSGGGRNTNYYQ